MRRMDDGRLLPIRMIPIDSLTLKSVLKIYMIGNGFFWSCIAAVAGLAAMMGFEVVQFGDKPATGWQGLAVVAVLCLISWAISGVLIGAITYAALRIWAQIYPRAFLEKY
ncbi:hypothetical protein ACTL6U_13860 [Rhodovibrionaceae bacterium A322]